MKKIHFIFVLLLAMASFSRPAFATLVRSVNLSELVNDSQYVVKVRVLSKDVVMDTEESGQIVDYYTFEVLDWLKGTPTEDNQLVIKQIGQGEYTLDGYRIRQNFYFPQYEVGNTYVLFLPEAHPRTGLLAPLALQQGVFQVQTVNGREVVPELSERSHLLQARIPNDSKHKFLVRQLSTAKTDSSYENFKSMIQAAGAQ